MQKYFEKIKERLEEEVAYQNSKADAAGKTCAFEEIPVVKAREKMAECYEHAIEIVDQVAEEYVTDTNVGNKDGWIPFTEREADEEEKEAYGCDMMLSCKLPEEDEEILVTYKNGYVDTDTFLRDGYECYLDSGAEFVTEAIAWMPKPKGYQPKGE